jgi:hypothetical protein
MTLFYYCYHWWLQSPTHMIRMKLCLMPWSTVDCTIVPSYFLEMDWERIVPTLPLKQWMLAEVIPSPIHSILNRIPSGLQLPVRQCKVSPGISLMVCGVKFYIMDTYSAMDLISFCMQWPCHIFGKGHHQLYLGCHSLAERKFFIQHSTQSFITCLHLTRQPH